MKICFFIGSLYGGGAERVVCNLANYLVKKDYDVSILTMSDKQSYYIDKKVHWIKLLQEKERKGFFYDNCLRFYRLCQFVKNTNIDVYVALLPITIILLLLIRWLTKAKIICSERNNPSTYSLILKILLRCLAHKSDGWVFQTQDERRWYGTRIKNDGIKIIPNAINSDFIKPVYRGDRKRTIVSYGRMTKQKNHALLIKSFSMLHQEFPNYKLIIYGTGTEYDNLLKITQELGLIDYVEMPGYKTKIVDRIKDASLFVLSSDYEGMPNALMEAMALGLPCVSTDCKGGGAKYLINNGENGLLVPPNDEKALADAMILLLSNRKLAEQYGIKAHEICERLAPDVIYGIWEQFIIYIANQNIDF